MLTETEAVHAASALLRGGIEPALVTKFLQQAESEMQQEKPFNRRSKRDRKNARTSRGSSTRKRT